MYLSTGFKFVPYLLFPLVLWGCQKTGSIPRPEKVGHKGVIVQLQLPTGVCIGNSIIAGHPWRNSGLELGILNYPDSFGQISYHLTQLTNFSWIDHGWGGQTTGQIRNRFMRDAIGDPSDPGDGLGAVTLMRKPDYVVVEGGINDIAMGVALDSIERNLAWMASICKRNQIHCIVLNSVGQGYSVFHPAQINLIFQLNDWLAGGALDGVGATVVDINSLWNSGFYRGISPYGNDNIHFSSLVNPGDGIHFTRAGYDSVAHAIAQAAVLSK
jgi:hypothetical protein